MITIACLTKQHALPTPKTQAHDTRVSSIAPSLEAGEREARHAADSGKHEQQGEGHKGLQGDAGHGVIRQHGDQGRP